MNLSSELTHRFDQAAALIFDMDGTLVDSMPLHFEAWKKVTEHFGLPFSEKRFYQLGGVPTFETLEILSSEANVSIDIPAAKAMKENLYRSLLPNVQPFEITLNIVKHYFGQKPIAIATGSSQKGAQMLLSNLSLISYFDAIVTSDDVENHKPAPDVFLEAASQLSIDPIQCIAFEDTDIGMTAIERAGMLGVDVRTLFKA